MGVIQNKTGINVLVDLMGGLAMGWKRKLIGLIVFALLVALAPTGALAEQLFLKAPLNPELEQYLFEKEVGLRMAATPEGHPLGHIPPPQPWLSGKAKDPLTAGVALRKAELLGYPASFDLRTSGEVTPVKDQKACGSCWAFGSYGSLESYVMPKSPNPDYSEKHLVWNHGFDPGPCGGGLELMTIAYLSRWSGPANESACPYNYTSTWTNCGASKPVQKHIQNAEYFEYEMEKIKDFLTTGGGISSSFYMDNSYYNATKAAYYYDGSLGKSSNHTVTIIGWDDNYPNTNFSILPPDNGAFLVKNSWGTAWGDNGYFWVSYFDALFGTQNWAFHNAEATTNYVRNYQYDKLGWVNTWKCSSGNPIFGANIFTAKAGEKLKAISFYTAHPNQSVRYSVYVDVTAGSPTSGTRKVSKLITLPNVGYHTVKLPSAVALTKGKNFSVVLRYAPSWSGLWPKYVLPTEAKLTGYSSGVTPAINGCFVSCDGKAWADLGASYGENNPIKAFTSL
jgi:C1A family cysteine protease